LVSVLESRPPHGPQGGEQRSARSTRFRLRIIQPYHVSFRGRECAGDEYGQRATGVGSRRRRNPRNRLRLQRRLKRCHADWESGILRPVEL